MSKQATYYGQKPRAVEPVRDTMQCQHGALDAHRYHVSFSQCPKDAVAHDLNSDYCEEHYLAWYKVWGKVAEARRDNPPEADADFEYKNTLEQAAVDRLNANW